MLTTLNYRVVAGQEGLVPYILSAADLTEMNSKKQQRSRTRTSNNLMAEYFARKYCSHLEDKQLTFLSNRRTLRRIGSVRAVRDFVHYLINRFVIILSSCI